MENLKGIAMVQSFFITTGHWPILMSYLQESSGNDWITLFFFAFSFVFVFILLPVLLAC